MKEYNLYLDESGNFGEDLIKRSSPECLVGGWLKESRKNDEDKKDALSLVAENWRNYIPEWKNDTDNMIFYRVNHAYDNRMQYPDVFPNVLADMFKGLLKENAEFCILSNKNKARIHDSNKTYLNILSGGVVFVLQRIARLSEEKVCLNVIIGGRRDSEKIGEEIKYYIPEEDYSRIEEAVDKAKINNPIIKDCQVKIRFEDDKKYPPLVISDYICYYYFTHKRYDYGTATSVFENGRKIIYKLGDELQDSEAHFLRSKADFSGVLNLLCQNEINPIVWQENIEWLNSMFNKDPQILRRCFAIFNEKLDRYVTDRQYEYSMQLIEKAQTIIQEITDLSQAVLTEEAKEVLDLTACSLYLYMVTIYSHQGNQCKQKEYFGKCKRLLETLPESKTKSELSIKYYNREALFKNYSYDVFGADAECVEAEAQLENDGIYVRDELGKMLGTHVQVKLSAFNMGLIDYAEVVEFSEKATETLTAKTDKSRQYQYRADFEADSGNIFSALDYLAKGAQVDSWENISIESGNFIFYHLSRIGVSAVRNKNNEIAGKILEKCKVWLKNNEPNLKANVNTIEIMPHCITFFNLALIQVRFGKIEYAERMRKIAEKAEKSNISFAPQLFAEIALCRVITEINKEYVCSKLELLCEKKEFFVEETRNFYKEWHDTLLNGNDKDLENFAKTRLY